MGKKVKIGVIGCGRIANASHLPSYRNNPDAELVYVCDILKDRADEAAKEYGAKAVYDYKEVINDPEIDAISICTPNYCHSSIAIEALNAGKDVLCEKPAARILSEAEEMREAKNKTGKILNIGVVNRFKNGVNKVKELIEGGELGNIHHVYMSFRAYRSIPGIGGAFTTKAISGGGVLIDWGIHFIDLVLYCCGEPKAKTVSSETFCHLGKDIKNYNYVYMWAEPSADFNGTCDIEESITGLIRTDGPVISFNGAWAQNIDEDEMFIDFMGDKGGIRYMYRTGEFTYYSTKNGMLSSTKYTYRQGDAFQNEIDAYIKAVQEGNDQLPSNININIETSRIMDAIYRSAEQHREITL